MIKKKTIITPDSINNLSSFYRPIIPFYNDTSLSKLLGILIIFLFFSCGEASHADMVIKNGNIYTVSDGFSSVSNIIIEDGKIKALVDDATADEAIGSETQVVELNGAFVMPGFIEGHGHYSGLGYSLLNLNFLKSKSWEEIVSMVEEKVKESDPGTWIIGRGWHQEKWDSTPIVNIHGYPIHDALSKISPDHPVILSHASGHSLYANKKAMDLAGVSKETANPSGGEIVRDRSGEAIGVFEERAMGVIRNAYQEYLKDLSQEALKEEWYEAVKASATECLQKGITSFQDAGSSYEEMDRYADMAEAGDLDLRLWVMARLSSENLKGKIGAYRKVGVGNDFYTCRAIKSEVDGALGAFGAWLLKPYNDKPGFVGQNTTDIYEVKKIADIASANDMQLCVHAIGDKANNVVLDIYESLNQKDGDHRWRIEHAQHIDTNDIARFKEYNIIASMQGIHCTSDAPFVQKRLGYERAKYGSYPWRSLLDEGVIIANGTDAPVEDVDPLPSFYASVTRKRIDNGFEFFAEQSMTREEAIYSYTLGNAYAAFEEKIKGSIEPGKYADLVVLSEDLINCSDEEILRANVLHTILNGEIKYSAQ